METLYIFLLNQNFRASAVTVSNNINQKYNICNKHKTSSEFLVQTLRIYISKEDECTYIVSLLISYVFAFVYMFLLSN